MNRPYNKANLRMHPRPGKFEGEFLLAETLYDMSVDGCDSAVGSVIEDGTWYGLLRGPFRADDKGLNADELAFLESLAGAIICENEFGFVAITYATDVTKLEAAWAAIESKFIEEGGDD
jgi:hypothetical protein